MVIIAVATGVHAEPETEQTASQRQFFENRVRPVLSEHCYQCHAVESEKVKGSLLLDSKAGWQRGGDSGQVIYPGDAENSLLIRMVRHDSDVEAMPPKSKLKPNEIEDLVKWINEGAYDPRDQSIDEHAGIEEFDLDERRKWWSFQPVRDYPVPLVKNTNWPNADYDHFVLAALESKGWSPSEPASKSHLLRRLSFDLIGLAPTKEEMEAFLNDSSSDAYEKQVDRLLASPHFGEKWARHWMDIIRYGETKAFEFDYTMPYAYQYRDYLIRAFNADVPYNKFIQESFAGDLIDEPRYSEDGLINESIHGPGFMFLTVGQHGPPDIHEDEARVFSDVIDTASKAYLGLTVACARCHDHKFDAISTGDYYSLYGMLRSSRLDITNSVSAQTQLEVQKRLKKLEPTLRRAALADASEDADQFTSYEAALKELIETDTYQQALDAYEAEKEKLKAANKQEDKAQFDPVARFSEGLSPAIEETAKNKNLDALVLESWVSYVALPERHSQWPQLEPLFRYLSGSPESETVPKTVKKVHSSFKTDFNDWMASGPAFQDNRESTARYKFSPNNDQRVIRTIIDASKPNAGMWSGHITGTIRSPDFILDGKPIQLYARGNEATVRLVVRNYELAGRGPTTGLLSQSVNQESWQHIVFWPELWEGEPAYLEIVHGGNATKALMPHQSIKPVSSNAFVSVSTLPLPDWQLVWEDREPEIVVKRLLHLAEANTLTSADAEVLGAMFEAGLVRAGADRSPELNAAVTAHRLVERQIPEPRFVRSLTEGTQQNVPIYIRGHHKNLSKEDNPRRNLDGLGGHTLTGSGSGRKEFANYISAEQNPFASRVMVNRVWHYLFGRGIVSSVDDFGMLGTQPSHPELLDYLSNDFMDNDWSVKQLIRQLVLGSTYRMSSVPSSEAIELDPDNIYLQRMPIKRLEAEQIRDHILLCSGTLNTEMFGPSPKAYVDDLPAARGRPKSGPLDGDGRRSVYMEIRRSFLPSFLSAFGMPNATETTGMRNRTNIPGQSLALMNSPFVHEQSKAWAERLINEIDDLDARINEIHYTAFGRPATDQEIQWSYDLLKETAQMIEARNASELESLEAWQALCHVVMNRKEFIYVF